MEIKSTKPSQSSHYSIGTKIHWKILGEKVLEMRIEMKAKKADVLVLSALDDVAWLFNLRGSDIEYNPCFFSYAVITNIEVYLFVDESQVTKAARQHLSPSSENQENIKMKIVIQ